MLGYRSNAEFEPSLREEASKAMISLTYSCLLVVGEEACLVLIVSYWFCKSFLARANFSLFRGLPLLAMDPMQAAAAQVAAALAPA